MAVLTKSVEALLAPVLLPLRHRSLIAELSKREVLGRYRGANFGLFWSLISPFMLLAVYSFAFGSIMRGRWPQAGEHESFTLILFIGLIVHGFFSECIMRAPQLVLGNVSYVKRVIFPLEILPWPMIMSALFHLMTNFLVFIALRIFVEGKIDLSIVLFPLVVLPLVILAFGFTWMLAALGVYFRDVNQITGVISTALLFTSSAIMPVSSVSEKFRIFFVLNPLTFIIDQAREVALWGHMPNWGGLGIYTLISCIVAVIGCTWFNATRRGFADVL